MKQLQVLVGVKQRLPMKLIFSGLPTKSARPTFERADDIVGDPDSLKIAFLWLHAFPIDKTGFHFTRVKGNIARERFIWMGWLAVVPRSVSDHFVAYRDGVV